MSDEELRHLERSALSGDLSSALRYLLAFERHGGMQVSDNFPKEFPEYTYTSKYGEVVINPKGEQHAHGLEGGPGLIAVYAPTCVPSFKAELWHYAPLSPSPSDKYRGQVAWRVTKFQWWASDEELDESDSRIPTVSDQLEQEVAAWAAAHSTEMILADNLRRQYHLKWSLGSLHRKYQEVKEQEEELAKTTIAWLSKKGNHELRTDQTTPPSN